MGRKEDLGIHIRESYELIREYEEILRLSDDPKGKARARRAIEEQRELIRSFLAEYNAITNQLRLEPDDDIAQIAIHVGDITSRSEALNLSRVLADTFSEQELRLLCFDFGLDLEDFRGSTLKDKITSLIDFLQRRARLDELVAYVRRERPKAM